MVNYGAYTSFKLEDGGVRGLDLHLSRLVANSIELFGEGFEPDHLRDLIRAALGKRDDVWVRISLFSPRIWARLPSERVRPKVMTVVSPSPPPLARSVRAQVQTYVRDAAHIKHTATFPLILARRLAQDAGFDDALFADADGLISEGSLWNIGFLSGNHVVWPQAPMLPGVTQALISRGLSEVGLTQITEPIHVRDLSRFDGAFLCNSATPACVVTTIGERDFGSASDRVSRVSEAWHTNPVEPV